MKSVRSLLFALALCVGLYAASTVDLPHTAREPLLLPAGTALQAGSLRLLVRGGQLWLWDHGQSVLAGAAAQAITARGTAISSEALRQQAATVRVHEDRFGTAEQVTVPFSGRQSLTWQIGLYPDRSAVSVRLVASSREPRHWLALLPLAGAAVPWIQTATNELWNGNGYYDGAAFRPLSGTRTDTSYFVGAWFGQHHSLVAGTLTASTWVSGTDLSLQRGVPSALTLVSGLPSGGSTAPPEQLATSTASERMALLIGGASPPLGAYAHWLALQSPGLPPAAPLLGWGTWGADLNRISATVVAQGVSSVARTLKGSGYRYIEVDDGWEAAYGDWQASGAFPGGMAALAATIHRAGFRAGIWIAPFLVNPRTKIALAHPDWFVRTSQGTDLIGAHQDLILDVTNPAALAYFRSLFVTLRGWHYDFVKADFLYEGAVDGVRFNPAMTGLEAYNLAMRTMDQALETDPGHPVTILASGAPMLPSQYANAWRTGPDIESYKAGGVPIWSTIVHEATSAAAHWFMGRSLIANDPDDIVIGPLPDVEARTLVTMDALAGDVFESSDTLSSLSPYKLSLLRNPRLLQVATARQAARPSLPAPAGLPPTIWLKPLGGRRYALGVFNWAGAPRRITVLLRPLGLVGGSFENVFASRVLHPGSRFSLTLAAHASALYVVTAR